MLYEITTCLTHVEFRRHEVEAESLEKAMEFVEAHGHSKGRVIESHYKTGAYSALPVEDGPD